MYLQKSFLLPFTSQTNFSSNWTLAFLSSFLHMQPISLCFFQVACLSFHLLYVSFLCLSSHRSSMFIHAGLLPQLLNCLNIVMERSYAPRQLPLKISQAFWASALQGIFPQFLPSRPLKSAHLKSLAVILFFVLLAPPRIWSSTVSHSLQPRPTLAFTSSSSSSLFMSSCRSLTVYLQIILNLSCL